MFERKRKISRREDRSMRVRSFLRGVFSGQERDVRIEEEEFLFSPVSGKISYPSTQRNKTKAIVPSIQVRRTT